MNLFMHYVGFGQILMTLLITNLWYGKEKMIFKEIHWKLKFVILQLN